MRTHKNHELRINNVGQDVTLVGWVAKKRNLGGLLFIDLRDRYGITQITSKPNDSMYVQLENVKNEFVLKVKGTVLERESKNPNLATGDIEVYCTSVEVFSEANQTPLIIADETDALEDVRMKYRYLDLRRPIMQENLRLRHKVTKAVRDFFDRNDFIEVETPMFGKSTPEGARDYLVPSRVHPGKFYALPQSPQMYKQLLMISGLERYYQIAKCFRDEDLRADRQMEFTQIDVEMSFVEEKDIYPMIERMLYKVFKDAKETSLTLPFKRLTFEESMDLYGTDKPDLRFDMKLQSIQSIAATMDFAVFQNAIANGGQVKSLLVKGGSKQYSRKDIDTLTEEIKKFKAKGLAWLKYDQQTFTGSIIKFLPLELQNALIEHLKIEEGDLLLIVADARKVVNASLGYLRTRIAKDMKLIDTSKFEFVWITDWPSFEYDEEEGRYVASHHPFTAPKKEFEDLLLTEPEKCYSTCYDIVLNGYELGSGSIRIHNQKIQSDMFKAIGLSDIEIKEKFGYFVDALKYGTPPHGGIALGLDRLIMLMAGLSSIRDVIAFPKSASAICPMSEAPTLISKKQLDELKISIDETKGVEK